MHFRLQPGSGDRGERALAAFRAIRGRTVGKGDQGPADQQVQRFRLRDDDELRGGGRRHSEPQRLHSRQSCTPSKFQDQQDQGCVGRATELHPATARAPSTATAPAPPHRPGLDSGGRRGPPVDPATTSAPPAAVAARAHRRGATFAEQAPGRQRRGRCPHTLGQAAAAATTANNAGSCGCGPATPEQSLAPGTGRQSPATAIGQNQADGRRQVAEYR